MPMFDESKTFLASLRAACLALLMLASGGAWAQPVTALWYQSDYGGAPHLLQAPTDVFSIGATNSTVSLHIDDYADYSSFLSLKLAAPAGQSLRTGAYEGAQSYSLHGSSPGLEAWGSNIYYCGEVHGRFTVLEALYDSNSNLVAFAANFEQRCYTGTAATFGELRINSSVPLTINKPPGSTPPDSFAFAPRTHTAPSASFVSDATTIYGINAPAPISIAGGEYSVNDGAFTSAAGSVNNRDRVRVRAIASASEGTTTGATLDVGGVSATFNVTTRVSGQSINALYFRSVAGEPIGQGVTLEAYAPQWNVTAARMDRNVTRVQFDGATVLDSYYLSLAAVAGAVLVPGAYEEAEGSPFHLALPGLSFGHTLRSCTSNASRFVVLEADFGPGSTVNRFAANFEQQCGTTSLFGEVRFNSAVPLTLAKAPNATLPDPFSLSAQGPVRPGAIVNSNRIAIYGVNAPVPISISGGEYSLNGAVFTSGPGTAQNMDHIVVRLRASNTPGTVNSATLDAGGRTATLSVATFGDGMSLTGLYYRSTNGDYIGQGQTHAYLSPASQLVPSSNIHGGVSFDLTGVGEAFFSLDFASPTRGALSVGNYAGAQRFPFQGSGTPGLDFAGDGRGCNQLAGSFVVRDVLFGSDGSLQRFAADFEQRCEITGPPLFGEVRYNSSIPFSYLLPDPAALTIPAPGNALTGSSQLFQWSDAGATLYQLAVGSSVGSSDLGVFPAAGTSSTSTLVTGLPTDGRTLFVRLYSMLGATNYFRDYTYVALNTAPVPATILSPINGSTLAGASQAFEWNSAPGATSYQLWVGSSVGANDLGSFPATGTSGTTATATGLPTDRRTLYVRLYSLINGTNYFRDFAYVAAAPAVPVPAAFTVPAPGSPLAGATQAFQWNAAPGATLYQVWVGNAVGTYDIGYFPAAGTSLTSTTINGLPTDGRTLYVRLYSNIAGSYYFRDFVYAAANLVPVPATIASPASGGTLAGASQTFTWNAAPGATLYQVWVGNSVGAYDIGYFPTLGTTGTSTTITGLPTDGRTLYVRLYSNIRGTYYFRDFTYMASAPATPTPAAFTTPASGSTLGGATQTFQWNAAPGAMLYQVWVGSSPGAYDIGYFPTLGTTGTSATVTGLPTDGRTLNVRLYSNIGGTYYFRDFIYFASGGSGPPVAASFTSPLNGSALSGGSQLFQWTVPPPGARLFQVWVGSSVGAYDLGYYPPAGTTATSLTLTGLPTDGRTIYVRLYSLVGDIYHFRDYAYLAGP